MPRKKLPEGEKVSLVRAYVKEKIVDKFGIQNCQAIAQKAIEDKFNNCNGTCEICICNQEANVNIKERQAT